MNIIKLPISYLYARWVRLAERDQMPYATHIPVLMGLSRLVNPKTVIEFGSGEFSTPMFLDRGVFPALQSMKSYENNRDWHAKVATLVSSDSRGGVELVNGPIASAVTARDVQKAELIFVDDSDERGRIETIKAIAGLKPRDIPVIVHDFELWRLRRTGQLFEQRFTFNLWNPQTAVLWSGTPPWSSRLPQLASLLRRNIGAAKLTHAPEWAHILSDL